jgi:CBS domain-containing membrane protein
MEREKSLDLDCDVVGRGDDARPVVRIALTGPQGCTRDGSSATVTASCESAAALEREVDRLRDELEDALARGCAHLGTKPDIAKRARPTRASGSAQAKRAAAPKKRLDLDWTVADVMTREVRTIDKNDSLANASKLMESGGFRHLVVVDGENAIEGVLSARDLFHGPLAWSLGQGRTAYEKLLEASRVKDAMHEDVETVEGSEPLRNAAARMLQQKIGCLPVVEGERLTGLLTEGDFLMLVAGESD